MNKKPKKINALYDFCFFPNFDQEIENLANNLAHKEPWDFNSAKKPSYQILKNYIFHTFEKLEAEKKILFASQNKFACFNTGLVTNNWEEIFAFFEKNRNQGKQDFVFKDFIKKSDTRLINNFSDIPEIANYFSKPEDLIFNPTLEIIPQIDHIVEDNIDRFPNSWQNSPKEKICSDLDGAIRSMAKKIRTNYTLAVPQYFGGKIQLLLPLHLTYGSDKPDLALVIHKTQQGNAYTARTCLTLEMAYNNARLIVKPLSSWLEANQI
ncbi:DUF3825 domain-containing protein [Acinetobacter baumannii]|uniref:DUF3825 domain-containing protein n=1 Tax=Acinetobacter baumannii TaxID=470 RepID=UPI003AF4A93A